MKDILRSLFVAIIGFIGGLIFMIYRCGYILENAKQKANKYFLYFNFLDRWLICKEKNYNFADFFEKNNIKTVAIYGMGKIGKLFKEELERTGITISYVIDEGESVIYGKEEHYNLHDKLPLTDLVVVTPIDEFEEIKDRILKNNRELKVISVDKVLTDS